MTRPARAVGAALVGMGVGFASPILIDLRLIGQQQGLQAGVVVFGPAIDDGVNGDGGGDGCTVGIITRAADSQGRRVGAVLYGAIGNYGEIYERTMGPNTPVGLPRGPNRLHSDGGLLYALPMR